MSHWLQGFQSPGKRMKSIVSPSSEITLNKPSEIFDRFVRDFTDNGVSEKVEKKPFLAILLWIMNPSFDDVF
uniref:Uncharacterized protein n=1 Tax=Candidatus Kentrum sp. LFY TaxID=2126342 RepID=A0A450UNN4_9GAMM|nr:MAG: hypothetical protein BECKLFY1418B_GA0070995_105412 [Candidatus Kentron sp. LFY]